MTQMTITNEEKYIVLNGTPVVSPELFANAIACATKYKSERSRLAVEVHIEKMIGHRLKITFEQIEEMNIVVNSKQHQKPLVTGNQITVCEPGHEHIQAYVYEVVGTEVFYIKKTDADDYDSFQDTTPKFSTAHGFVVRGW